MRKINLCGFDWRLFYVKNDKLPKDGEISSCAQLEMAGFEEISSTVPGNIEIDLMRAGKMDDPYFGANHKIRDNEYLHGFYVKSFTYEGSLESPALVFEGLDTVADIYLNGKWVARCENMLIPHTLSVKDFLHIGENELLVHIIPAVIEARKYPLTFSDSAFKYNKESLYLRKAPHTFGWDIMPRIVSQGIWREVYIKDAPSDRIIDFFIATSKIEGKKAHLYFNTNMAISHDECLDYTLKIHGECENSVFDYQTPLYHTSELGKIIVENPKLWWPRFYGEQNLYDVTVELYYKGGIVDKLTQRTGIRTVSLSRTSTDNEQGEGDFTFIVNGVPVFCMGTNWVPVDALHSRDKERIPEILPMLLDTNCNTVRLWGGNVYEDDIFYNFCDEHGIMLWQDFIMGCATYPQDDEFCKIIAGEITVAVKRLRHHPSIILWAGDNENDIAMNWTGQPERDPNLNRITRKVIPHILNMHDFSRPYLPSSPYIDEEAYKSGKPTSEDHLWGPRDYFKGEFYGKSVCHFASETGYHACPSPKSVEKFIPEEYVFTSENSENWQGIDNPMWLYHSACPEATQDAPYIYRIRLMADQVSTLFGNTVPNTLSDFAKASQISQAEAKKYFIERFRITKGRRSGIIWWNLIDGWPQFSDAIVDYYGVKKLAYHYVKRSQNPLCLMIDEPRDGMLSLYAVNEESSWGELSFKVTDLTDKKLLVSGTASYLGRASEKIADFEEIDGAHYLFIEWECGGRKYTNHYITNIKNLNYEEYLKFIDSVGYSAFEGF